jgi:serine/threonine protein kinase
MPTVVLARGSQAARVAVVAAQPSKLDADAALPKGTRLGEFAIMDVIGVGGFSVVYRATDIALLREVAVKEYLPSALCRRDDGLELVPRNEDAAETFGAGLKSFVNEARFLASFDHSSLLKVYRFWEANGTAYMAMPILGGQTLAQRRRTMAAPPDEAWLRALLDPLLGAIETLHARGVYHRDIAPDNIFVEADGRPVLLDFGAARRVIEGQTQSLTVILKPSYAPIEQYGDAGSGHQGPWTDLYSLGATLHFLLRGQPPAAVVTRAMKDTQPPLAGSGIGGVSDDFLRVVDWMLALQPQDRPQDVAALRAALANPAQVPSRDQMALLTLPSPAAPADGADPFAPGPTMLVPRPAGAARAADAVAPVDSTMMFGPASKEGRAQGPAVVLTVTMADQGAFIGRKVVIGDAEVAIGRASAAFTVPDPAWSRQHASVRSTSAGVVITDLGSSNGTFVNGFALKSGQPYPLHLGASVRIGSTVFALTLADDPSPPNLAGTDVDGTYSLLECLHASPKGMLYRARKKGSGLEVALKILSPAYAAYPGYRERFVKEAAVASRLVHPHICRLDHFGETVLGSGARVPYLSYQMLAGGDLAARLPKAGEIGSDTIAGWLRDLAAALQHAHAHGVVHGNLKPSAVCFDEASNIYLTDFAIGADGSEALLGTPAFMAPEQWTGAAQPESDQYALAVLAYLLLAGVRPFEGQDDPDTRSRNWRRGPAPLHQEASARLGRQLPVACSRAVERALATDPSARHAGPAAFATELARALQPGAGTRGATPVFISYRRGSSAGWVVFIADQLEREHGIGSFVDTQRLDGALKFPQRIERAIESCEVFVCLLDAETLGSPHVRHEIALAHHLSKRMIPVFQEGFAAAEDKLVDPAVAELLLFDGVKLLDRQNVYVRAAVAELAQQIRTTLGMPSSGR